MTFTVVIADDDNDIRDLVVIAVERAGLRVVATAADGIAALAALREHQPDLAILDVTMPGLTGIQVCEAVRDDPTFADLRILLVSASVDEAAQRAGLAAGADYFLPKPFSPRQLVAWLAVGKEER